MVWQDAGGNAADFQAAHPNIGKGPLVARERPTDSDVPTPVLACLDGGRPDNEGPLLTRAEARAMARSARLTHADLQRHLDGVEAPLRSA
jgi:hypothetical protein